MKTQLLTLLFAAGIATISFAQSKSDSLALAEPGTKFSIGAEAGVPVGDMSTGYNLVLGGSAKVEVPTSHGTYFTITAGYSVFFAKDFLRDFGFPSTSGFIPLKAGLKCYSGNNFFIEGQAGIVFSTEGDSEHAFAWSPGIGYTLNNSLEVGARYEGWTNGGTTGQITARLAYRF
jgi:hypothetical protein